MWAYGGRERRSALAGPGLVTDTRLVVATFNVRTGLAYDRANSWPLRRRSTAALLRRLDADVVGLQEAHRFQLRYLSRAVPGYDTRGEGRSPGGSGGEHCPVLTRRSRLQVVSAWTRWFGDHPDRPGGRLPHASFPRIATGVRLHDPVAGIDFDVVNTHLDEHRADNRARSSAQLASWLSPDHPTVVLGDLNTTADDEAVMGPLAGAGLVPALRSPAGGSTHGFTGRVDGPLIDHILVSRHWEVTQAAVVAARTGWRLPSDHWPVVGVIRPVS